MNQEEHHKTMNQIARRKAKRKASMKVRSHRAIKVKVMKFQRQLLYQNILKTIHSKWKGEYRIELIEL